MNTNKKCRQLFALICFMECSSVALSCFSHEVLLFRCEPAQELSRHSLVLAVVILSLYSLVLPASSGDLSRTGSSFQRAPR